MTKNRQMRVDLSLRREILDIAEQAKNMGLKEEDVTSTKVTEKIAKHSLFGNIKTDILDSTAANIVMKKIRRSKKGQSPLTGLFTWIAVSFATVLIIAVFLYGMDQITTGLRDVGSIPGSNINFTTIVDQTIGQLNLALGQLRFFAVLLIFGMGMSILISNFIIKANPVFFWGYSLIVAIAIYLSIQVTIAYNSLLDSGLVIETALLSMRGANFMMQSLPVWVTIIGFGGAIFLFMGIRRDAGLGGGL